MRSVAVTMQRNVLYFYPKLKIRDTIFIIYSKISLFGRSYKNSLKMTFLVITLKLIIIFVFFFLVIQKKNLNKVCNVNYVAQVNFVNFHHLGGVTEEFENFDTKSVGARVRVKSRN